MHTLLFTLGGVTEKKVLYVNVYLLLVCMWHYVGHVGWREQ